MLKKVFVLLSLMVGSTAFANGNWFVGGSAEVGANLNPTNVNIGANFDFGYKTKTWDAFGEVNVGSLGGGFKAGMDAILNETSKDYWNLGFVVGAVNGFDSFSAGVQFGYNYYIQKDFTIGGGVRGEYLFGGSGVDLSNMNVSGLFTFAYHIPNK